MRVPDPIRIGEVTKGWRVALTTLMNERSTSTADFAGAGAPSSKGRSQDARRLSEERRSDDPPRRRPARATRWEAHEVVRISNLCAAQRARTPAVQGRRAPSGRSLSAELTRTEHVLVIELLGAAGAIDYDAAYAARGATRHRHTKRRVHFLDAPRQHDRGRHDRDPAQQHRERVFGPPGDIRVDKGIPWKDGPRSP